MTGESDIRAMLRLLAGAAMISFAPVFVRLVDVPPTSSAFYRTLLGGIFLTAYVRLSRETLWGGPQVVRPLLVAGAFFALDLWAWHQSIWFVGPGLATLLANFQVFFMALAGIFLLKEPARPVLWVAIPLALTGLGLIVGVDWDALGPDYRLGLAYGLLTAFAYAGYLLSLRRARMAGSRASVAGDLAVASFVSAACLWLVALVEDVSLGVPTAADWGLLASYALVAQVLGWILITGALSRVRASTVGLLLLLQPTLAFVWDVLLFARPFGPREVAGALLAIGAIYLGSRPARRSAGPGAT
jgi:drug/metabolite transporter (DMT)-like permease